MVNFEQLLVSLLEQQQQLQINGQYCQTKDEAMQHKLESFCAQNNANQCQDDEEALVLMWALAFLGTPGQFQQLQTYLARADLPGVPMAHSAWAFLWKSRSNRAFITTMSLDDLLERFVARWNYSTID
jgi:hypothetical protein